MIPHVASAAHLVLLALLDGLWEGVLFALAAAVVLRFTPRGNATTRYAVLNIALVAVLIVPIVTAIVTTAQTARRADLGTVLPATALYAPRASAIDTRAPVARRDPPQTRTLDTPSTNAIVDRVRLRLPSAIVNIVLAAWLLGVLVLVLVLRLVVSLAHLERLKRDALPLPVDYRTRLTAWTAAAKGSRGVCLCRSADVTVPIAVGLFDAMILIPETLIDELADDDIDRIVLHELAHLRRNDDWLNVVERFALAILFFNPAAHWLAGRLDLEREVACDDWVVTQTSQALPYAHCLLRVVESAIWPHRAMAAPGVFVTRRSMSIRIERLLKAQRDVRSTIALAPASLVLAAIAGVAVGAGYLSPSFADEPPLTAIAPRVLPTRAAQRVVRESQRPTESMRSAPTTGTRSKPVPVRKLVTTPTTVARPKLVTMPKLVAMPKLVVLPKPNVAVADADYADTIAAAGYPHLTLDELVQLKNVGVTAATIRDLADAGLTHLNVRELVTLRAVGVGGAYVRGMRAAIESIGTDELTSLRAVGVSPEYARAIKAANFTNLTARDLVGARAVGVDTDYARFMHARFNDATLAAVRDAHAMGVSPEYAKAIADAGFANLRLSDLGTLHAVGIDAAFLKRVQDHGFGKPSVNELIRIKTSGLLWARERPRTPTPLPARAGTPPVGNPRHRQPIPNGVSRGVRARTCRARTSAIRIGRPNAST